MSARELPAPDVTAFRLAALLERYEQDVEELTSGWPDADLHAEASRRLGEMRLLCAGCPVLSVPWVHVLISHTELLHCMWMESPEEAPRGAQRCKAEHLLAVRALRDKCLQQFTRTEHAD